MANDPNKLGKPATISRLEELGRRFTNRMMGTSAQEERLIERLSELDYQLSQLKPDPNTSAAELAQNAANIHTQRSQIEHRLRTIEGIRASVAGRYYSTGVETALRRSKITTDVNQLAGSAAIMGQAAGAISSPTYSLEQQQQQSMAAIISKSAELREAVRNNPGGNRDLIKNLGFDLNASMQSAAIAQGALNLQRRAGLDVRSRFLSSRDIISRLEGGVGASELAQNVAAGKVGTRAEHEVSLRAMLDEIGVLRREQANEVDPKKFEELQQAIDGLTNSAKGAADVLAEMRRQGASGGRFDRMRPWLSGIAAGAGFGANIVDTWSYENPARQRQNEIRYAELANRQFTDVQNALSGDMGALRRLGSAYGAAGDLNAATKMWSRASTGLRGVSGVAGSIVGARATGGGVGLTGLGNQLNSIIGGFSSINNVFANWNQQAGERGSSLAALDIERGDVRNFVQDALSQSFVNYGKGMGGASIGMGGLRSALMEQMMKPGTLRDLAGVGIGGDRAAELTRMAVGALGRQFNNVDVIQQAGMVERGGYMSAEQYFQSLGRMSNISGNAPGQFQEILKNAVAAGMDSAKNIQQMVDATAFLAEKSARMGIDMSGAAGDVLGRTVQGMINTPENMRPGAALAAIDFANRASSDKSLSFSVVAEQARISRAFPRASMVQREVLSGLNMTQIQDLMTGGQGAAERLGLGSLAAQVGSAKFQEELEKLKREKILNKFAPPGKIPGEIRQQIMSAKDLTNLPGEAGEVWRGLSTIAELSGEGLAGVLKGGTAAKGQIRTSATGEAKAADEMLIAQAEGQRRIIEEGRNIVGSLSNVAGALKEVAGRFDPRQMGEAVQDAAKKFEIGPIDKFDKAVTRLVEKLDALDNRTRK